MTDEHLQQWARELIEGRMSAAELRSRVVRSAAADLADSVLDVDRAGRCGFPEAVFGEGKSTEQLLAIAENFCQRRQPLLITRIDASAVPPLLELLPGAVANAVARTLRWMPDHAASPGATTRATAVGRVAVLTAGTTDRSVAEEAIETLAWMQIPAEGIWDVGVAGPQRLLRRLEDLDGIACAVVVAGMEGTLPSAVAGWVDCPVIAVPTSVGYGANLRGITALLAMLVSCAANVAVVNIDAGFKAGYLAGLIASRSRPRSESPAGGQRWECDP